MDEHTGRITYQDLERWVMRLAVFLSIILIASVMGKSSYAATSQSTEDTSEFSDRVFANYFGIFFGPSVGNPRLAYQPLPTGETDFNNPVLMKNYLTLGYEITPLITVSGTAYFSWTPVDARALTMLDPYVRLAHNSLISTDNFNLYGDVRFHFPITFNSRLSDMLAGFQTFQSLTYSIPNTKLTLGTYGSARYNVYGQQGQGTDIELYLAPYGAYQLTPTFALTLLYEMGTSRIYGSTAGLVSDGADLEPGFSWDITPELNISPWVNLYVHDKITWSSMSFGTTLGWVIK